MSLEPLLQASPVIQIHAFAAILALVVGGVVLFRRKGDLRHRFAGRIWVGLMVIVALSSLFIWTIRLWGPFSPIHLLSILTLMLLWRGVTYARRRNIKLHRQVMQTTYVLALVIAGLFTFFPGRIMYHVAFGPGGATPAKLAAFCLVVAIIAATVGLILRLRSLPGNRSGLAFPTTVRTIDAGNPE